MNYSACEFPQVGRSEQPSLGARRDRRRQWRRADRSPASIRPSVRRLLDRERARFVDERPRTRQLLADGARSMPHGVPMQWFHETEDHPVLYVAEGKGAYFTDVDGHRYLDTNVADMSMFCGYAPEPVVRAVSERVARGSQFLLPSEDALWVAEELRAGGVCRSGSSPFRRARPTSR